MAWLPNCIDGLANPWVEGVLGIFHHFARHGAAAPGVADWSGRWWTYWGAFDLVPMASKVFVTVPALMQPFTDATELEITSPTEGRIVRANGFGAYGEPARRLLAANGTPTLLTLGGTEMLPEQALLTELEDRTSDPTPVAQP